MRKAVVTLLLTAISVGMSGQMLAVHTEKLADMLVEPGRFEPLPRGNDPFWRDSVPEPMRLSYIRFGEEYLGKPWPALPNTVFAQFKENGNRVNYEGLCFEKRRHLGALVMAEIVEGKGRFLPDIIDGLGSFCEETWWGLPAHYGTKVPRTDDQNVDLFNAETASLVVWTAYMLQPQLVSFSPLVCERVRHEIDRRILQPARTGNYWWKTAGMNWNPWICSNWLACVLLCEQDRGRQTDAVGQILKAADAFVDSYKDDGGCDEGPGYWDRAAASLFEVLNLLRIATDGQIDASREPKLQAMASYVYKTYIGNGYVLNFADSHDNRYMQQLNIVYPFGRYMHDSQMTGFAKYIGEDKDYLNRAAQLYDKSGNFPTLGRELFFLRDIQAFQREQAREPLAQSVWLKDLQIWACRTPSTARHPQSALYVAMKGGTNGESHNHNDVGQVVVYADGEPLLIDPGVGEYTSKTFSGERYSIWTMQSGYHNLPQINGTDQRDGKEYGSRVIRQDRQQIVLDLAGAYPAEAAVSKWQRSMMLKKNVLKVTEDYELTTWKAPTRLMLMTIVEPKLATKGSIDIGPHRLTYDASQLEADIEDASSLLDPLLQKVWGQRMFRIVLTVKSQSVKGQVSWQLQ